MRVVNVEPAKSCSVVTFGALVEQGNRKDKMSHDKDMEKPNIDGNMTQNNMSIRQLWGEFRENSTMHGLKHARKEENYKLRGIIWIAALMTMGVLLVYTVYQLITHYRSNPTLTNIQIQFVKEIAYPAITICNLSPYKKSRLNASPVMTSHLFHASRLGNLLPPLNFSDPRYAELHEAVSEDWLDKVSFRLEDMFIHCLNVHVFVPCQEIVKEKITQLGKCFTFNGYNQTKNKGRLTGSLTGTETALTFYLNVNQSEYVYSSNIVAGVKVVLHDPDEEPDVYNQGFILRTGVANYVSMKMTKYKYLPAPYRAGGDRYCIDTKSSGFVNTLKHYPVYSRNGCLLECRRDFIVSKCGCKAATDPGNETICTHAETVTCYHENEVYFDSNVELKEECGCQILCEYETYDQQISTAAVADIYLPAFAMLGHTDLERNNIEIRFFYESLSFLSIETVPEYNSEDIVGILGGQMGIFLGASLLTISELFEFVVLAIAVVIKKVWYSLCKRHGKTGDASLCNS